MIVEALVRYLAMVRLKGERATRLRVVSEAIPFEVEEHVHADVVCRWNAPIAGAFAGRTETAATEVLAAGGSFFRREADRPVSTPEALRAALDGLGVLRSEDGEDFDLMEGTHRPSDVVDLSRAVVASIEPYDRRLRVGKLQERIGRYALVCGHLCEMKSEPVLVAGTNGGGLPGKAHMERHRLPLGHSTVTAAWSSDVDDGCKGRGVFRLDRLGEAVAFAAAYAGRTPDAVKVMASFELIAPECLHLDDEVFAVSASARQAFRHLGSSLPALPRPIVDAAFDLRDMLAAPRVRLDHLRDAFERVCDNLRPLVDDPNVECDRHTLRNVLEELDEAQDRLAAARPAEKFETRLVAP